MWKSIDSFNRDSRSIDEHNCSCKDCGKDYRKENEAHIHERKRIYYRENVDKIRAYQKVWCELNAERLKEYRKNYYETNKDRISYLQKLYYEANFERIKERSRIWYRENFKKCKKRSKEYYEKNFNIIREYYKMWCAENAEKLSLIALRHFYKRKGYGLFPINNSFKYSHGHHLWLENRSDFVIYIPAFLHELYRHNHNDRESMITPNAIALDYWINEKLYKQLYFKEG